MEILVTVEVVTILVIAAVIIGVDVYLVASPPEGDTFSALSRAWARLNPTWPLVFGLLAGRFFHWGGAPVVEPAWLAMLALAAITAILVLLFTATKWWHPVRGSFGMPVAFFVGYALGAVFWPVDVAGIRFA